MAIGIGNFTNKDTTDPSNYPNGCVKDDPAGIVGTHLRKETLNDIFLTFDKLLRDAGLTANNTFDNESNGYQYVEALNILTGRNAWTDAGTPSMTAQSATVTINSGNVIRNHYIITGRTIVWQISLSGFTLNTNTNQLIIALPTAISTDYKFTANMQFIGTTNASVAIRAITGASYLGPDDTVISINKLDGAAFSSATSPQFIHLTLTTELIDL